MAYSELIKNFEKIRAYMREFYVYGFKSRNQYDARSARSYDDERRRIESWLGDYMKFTRTSEGKNVFLSVDSRITSNNPFYKAWKAKSFTDGDITLHFVIFDILHSPEIKKTLSELIEEIDNRISSAMTFDESTIRKKLKEYCNEGIIKIEKSGRKVFYSRCEDTDISEIYDLIGFFSEVAPCGVVGSFLQDKNTHHSQLFTFKHHYITQAMDSDVLCELFDAMHKKCYITADNTSRNSNATKNIRLVPLKIYISAQNGRQHLIAISEKSNRLSAYRLDYLSKIKLCEVCEEYDDFKNTLLQTEKYMWGVNCRLYDNKPDHVEFEVRVMENEQHIVGRLEREKRCGRVEKIDETHYRYVADLVDANEMLPWLRTFISRITRIEISDREVLEVFRNDLKEMYSMYGVDGGDGNDIQ